MAYVLDNPVQAGLVTEWSDYPFSGGVLIDPSLDSSDPPTASPT